MGNHSAFISAGGYHHQIGLNTWHSKGYPPALKNGVCVYHTAILYPTRKDLAIVYNRILQVDNTITGASDHGVSETLYLDDPDGNGVELYWDKPKDPWPRNNAGGIDLITIPLDLKY